jgi:molybdopterin biosynthesis enzyme
MASLIALTDALHPIRSRYVPLVPERLAIEQAIGLPLAEALVTRRLSPAKPVALLSGFALSADALIGASAFEPAFLPSPSPVEAGKTLPDGTDCIVPADAVTLMGGIAEIRHSAAPWENVRPVGGDFLSGRVLAEAGSLLTPRLALVLAEAGYDAVSIRRVSIHIATGFPAAWRASAARWAEANGWLVGDQNASIALQPLATWQPNLALSPGVGVQLVDGSPIGIGVPPEPDSFVAAWHALVLPLGHILAGTRMGTEPVILTGKISSRAGLAELALLRRDGANARPLECGSMSLTNLAQADGIVLVAANSEGYPAGETIPMMPLGGVIEQEQSPEPKGPDRP